MNYEHAHYFLQVAKAGSVAAVCREWRLDRLLAELAVHTLDLVIADVPLPSTVSVKAFSHLFGSSRVGVFASRALKARSRRPFPDCLDGAPLLMPGEDSAVGQQLRAWFKSKGLRPRIAAEFDDSALAQEFGREGVGYVLAPEVLVGEIEAPRRGTKSGTWARSTGSRNMFTPSRSSGASPMPAYSPSPALPEASCSNPRRAQRRPARARAERRHDARSDTLAGSAQCGINSGTVIVRVTPPRTSSHRRE